MLLQFPEESFLRTVDFSRPAAPKLTLGRGNTGRARRGYAAGGGMAERRRWFEPLPERRIYHKQVAACPLSIVEIDALRALVPSSESFGARQPAHGTLLLFKNGRSYEDVADVFDVNRNTARNCAERWTAARIDSLHDRPDA
jgi:hypothetical protein